MMNLELRQTWQVELRGHSNPGSSSKPELRTHLNPSKKPNLKPVQPETSSTQAQIWKNWYLNTSKSRFVYQNWTMNPPWTLQKSQTSITLVKCKYKTFYHTYINILLWIFLTHRTESPTLPLNDQKRPIPLIEGKRDINLDSDFYGRV